MKCPICKTECLESSCPTCGFNKIKASFSDIKELNIWMENSVIPYMINYNKTLKYSYYEAYCWMYDFIIDELLIVARSDKEAKYLFDLCINKYYPKNIKYRDPSIIDAYNIHDIKPIGVYLNSDNNVSDISAEGSCMDGYAFYQIGPNQENLEYKVVDFLWEEFFYQHDDFKDLFKKIIPYSKYHDEAIPHICLQLKNSTVNKNFLKVLMQDLYNSKNIKKLVLYKSIREGDVVSFLGSLEPGEAFILRIDGNIKEDILSVLKCALTDFHLEFIIGYGDSERTISMDLPPFTCLFITENNNKITQRIIEFMDVVIKPDFTKEELIKLEICDYANRLNFILTPDTLEYLIDYCNNKHVKSVLRLLSDYLCLHPNIKQPIDIDTIAKILSNAKVFVI